MAQNKYLPMGNPAQIILFLEENPHLESTAIIYTGNAGWGAEWHLFVRAKPDEYELIEIGKCRPPIKVKK